MELLFVIFWFLRHTPKQLKIAIYGRNKNSLQ